MKTNNLKMITQKIKDFELINNGIDDALIDVTGIKITAEEIVCAVVIYDDDFSSKIVHQNVSYPLKIFKLT